LQASRGRKYRTTAEQATARTHFKKNLEYIVAENAKGSNPYILGITNFTDMSYSDFAAKFLMAPQSPPAAGDRVKAGRRLSGLRGESHRCAWTGCRGLRC
jgi:Cathepsin propeptide inhibitor domain (I29)